VAAAAAAGTRASARTQECKADSKGAEAASSSLASLLVDRVAECKEEPLRATELILAAAARLGVAVFLAADDLASGNVELVRVFVAQLYLHAHGRDKEVSLARLRERGASIAKQLSEATASPSSSATAAKSGHGGCPAKRSAGSAGSASGSRDTDAKAAGHSRGGCMLETTRSHLLALIDRVRGVNAGDSKHQAAARADHRDLYAHETKDSVDAAKEKLGECGCMGLLCAEARWLVISGRRASTPARCSDRADKRCNNACCRQGRMQGLSRLSERTVSRADECSIGAAASPAGVPLGVQQRPRARARSWQRRPTGQFHRSQVLAHRVCPRPARPCQAAVGQREGASGLVVAAPCLCRRSEVL
jgi:hypothetical protein